jgi:hypothetical protein
VRHACRLLDATIKERTLADVNAVLKKPYKPMEIEIQHVTRFSYGEMTDGAYVIWAQGKAGWFEIRPAAQYKPIYDEMVQAVELLYFVTDIYGESRKKGSGPSAELVFQEVSTRRDRRGLGADTT